MPKAKELLQVLIVLALNVLLFGSIAGLGRALLSGGAAELPEAELVTKKLADVIKNKEKENTRGAETTISLSDIAKEIPESEAQAEQAEKAAREKAAKEQAEKAAREKTAKEQAEKAAREKTAKEQAEKAAREKAAKEQAEKAAREKAAKEQAEKAAREKAAKEQAEMAAREKAAKEQAEKAAREKAAKEQAEKAAREKAAKEQAEKAAREKAAKEQAEKAAREKADKEQAEKAAREKAAKEQAEMAAREKADSEARAKAELDAKLQAEAESRAAEESKRLLVFHEDGEIREDVAQRIIAKRMAVVVNNTSTEQDFRDCFAESVENLKNHGMDDPLSLKQKKDMLRKAWPVLKLRIYSVAIYRDCIEVIHSMEGSNPDTGNKVFAYNKLQMTVDSDGLISALNEEIGKDEPAHSSSYRVIRYTGKKDFSAK